MSECAILYRTVSSVFLRDNYVARWEPIYVIINMDADVKDQLNSREKESAVRDEFKQIRSWNGDSIVYS